MQVLRICDAAGAHIAEHAHDWPVLSLYVAGECTNDTTAGQTRLSSPSAVFYRAGDAHANAVGSCGFEQVQIEFDPEWLRLEALCDPDRPRHWLGGKAALAARTLSRLWNTPGLSEARLAAATRTFFRVASEAAASDPPPWIGEAVRLLDTEDPQSTAAIALRLGLTRPWLAEAYRRATGEGLGETLTRRRVEAAATLLRTTSHSGAEIAAATGFCDQSHMIRGFRKILGRTPSEVRAEWLA